jgi:hypothetical protein
MKIRFSALALSAFVLSACASSSANLATSYISPIQYQNYTCTQLTAELQRVNRRAGELQAAIDQKANNDALQMGVGLVLFWPALLFLEGGDGPESVEYSRLKGERDAIEQVVIQKSC